MASHEGPDATVLLERSDYLRKLSETLREQMKMEGEFRTRVYQGSRELSDKSRRLLSRISSDKLWQFRKTTDRATS
jgi:hypothetical protein